MDRAIKIEAVKLLYKKMKYRGEKMALETALEIYIKQTLDNIGNKAYEIGEMEFLDA